MKREISRNRLTALIAEQLLANAGQIAFGACSVTLTLHGGKITKYSFTETNMNKFDVEESEVVENEM
jgi:hypothetical protein